MRTPALVAGGRPELAGRAGSKDTADTATSLPEQLTRRRAASWRLPPLESGLRDPWDPVYPHDWSDAEIRSWVAAAEHLRAHGLYSDSVRAAWYRRRCPCRGGDAA